MKLIDLIYFNFLQLWAKEREARSNLMKEVIVTLKKQIEEKIEANIRLQKENVLEREKILEQMDSFHQEVQVKERETQVCTNDVLFLFDVM